jgi:hypothetical protein
MDSLEDIIHLSIFSGAASGKPFAELAVFFFVSVALTAARRIIGSLLRTDASCTDAVRGFADALRGFSDALRDLAGVGQTCVWSIKHVQRSSDVFGYRSCGGAGGVHNAVLQKAVMVYAGDQSRELFGSMPRGSISLAETTGDMAIVRAGPGRRESDCVHTRIILSPPPNRWTLIRTGSWKGARYEISLNRACKVEDYSDGKVRETTDDLQVMGRCARDPAGLVEGFVRDAYDHYRRELQEEVETKHRFLFAVRAGVWAGGAIARGDPDDGEGSRHKGVMFSKHVLAEGRGLDTVYHPLTGAVRRLLDDFQAKSGKFAVEGHPYKVGFLLHGPPGCGKTSMVKAIAAHTGRHIVTVSLDKICSNGALEEVMTSERYCTSDSDGPVRVPISKVVFVLEDVDAASGAVRRRAGLEAPSPGHNSTSAGDDRCCAGHISTSAVHPVFSAGETREIVEDRDGTQVLIRRSRRPKDDELTLSGLLNVLDGIQDSPGRIVVMTTNHKDHLDPALIRPGRVTMELRMAGIAPDHAEAMVLKYFPDATPRDVHVLRAIAREGLLTPAALETLCGSNESFADVVTALSSIACG